MSMTSPQDNIMVPVTGDTVQAPNSDTSSVLVLNPAGTLAALTINMPTLPHGGQRLDISSTKAITALTLTGGTMTRNVPSLSANDSFSYIYDDKTTTWVRVNSISPTTTYPTRTIATTATTGFQISTTRNAEVKYTVQIVTTATIGSGQVGYVTLESSPDNSTWTEIGRVTNGQVITLAVALNSIQTVAGQISGRVPAGCYVRLRSVNTTGTPTYSYIAGQETLT